MEPKAASYNSQNVIRVNNDNRIHNMDIERIHQYHKAKNLRYEQRNSIRELSKKPAGLYHILEILIVLLEILFTGHQQR
jgi:hypothetical protein